MKFFIISLSALFSMLCFAQSFAANTNQLSTKTDKFSYVVGLNLGTSFKAEDIQVNPNEVLKGMQDGLSGAKPLLSKQQQQVIMQDVQKQVMKKMQAKQKAEALTNAAAGAKFLAENAKKPGVQTTKSGLQYKVLHKGHGPSPKATDSVTVNYEGKVIHGEIFDSSYKRGEPATFKVNQVIKGWTEALQMMHKGATWMLYIPAKIAYGTRAMGKLIPANSTLIFKVNLISIKK